VVSGLLLVDKPSGPTSHDVVYQARRALGIKKIGHSGTLDPMASGLLVLGVGQATKLLTYLVGADKTYEATIRLGVETTTDDAEGEPSSPAASPAALAALTDEVIHRAMAKFVGEISQVPSAVSAIKVGGKRAYKRVRDGEEVVLSPRTVRIDRSKISTIRREADSLEIDVVVDCSSGTYIRAIGRDLGRALGVGAHLSALRRTRVGRFGVAQASPTDKISLDRVIGLSQAVEKVMPTLRLAPDQAVELGYGRIPRLTIPEDASGGPVACIDERGDLIAIVSDEKGSIRILVGFPKSEVS
jgi:tRNA pseudouridine55 synthase